MVVTLDSRIILQKFIGDGNLFSKLPDKLKFFKSSERVIIPSVLMVSYFFMSLTALIDSTLKIRTYVIGACSSMMVVIGHSLLLAIYCNFVFNREKFYSFFEDVEGITSDSAWCGFDVIRQRRINCLWQFQEQNQKKSTRKRRRVFSSIQRSFEKHQSSLWSYVGFHSSWWSTICVWATIHPIPGSSSIQCGKKDINMPIR